MAVYTHLAAEELAELIAHYDVGQLVSAKGIAEGVSNSNWLVETTAGRFILTLYERRIETRDLPFFLGLLDHLSAKSSPVPRTIHDQDGQAFRMVVDPGSEAGTGKAAALIEFLPGVSIERPSAAQAHAVGAALAGIHLAASDYQGERANELSVAAWRILASDCGHDGLASIDPSLPALVGEELQLFADRWPDDLPAGVIHADLFPDNVLMLGSEVCGLIDFYFACNDFLAYDLAVTHAAWCFAGDAFRADVAAALMVGYESVRRLSEAERMALPLLARGASMRFLMTRAYDWLNTPANALVTRKDPIAFARRLSFYRTAGDNAFKSGAD
jgi:homoserine kinase type II